MITTTEIIKNNYSIDFTGIGAVDIAADDIKEMIESDITNNFDCVTYLSSLVRVSESLVLGEPQKISIHLYMKMLDCEEKESVIKVISSYITSTFLN